MGGTVNTINLSQTDTVQENNSAQFVTQETPVKSNTVTVRDVMVQESLTPHIEKREEKWNSMVKNVAVSSQARLDAELNKPVKWYTKLWRMICGTS